MTKSKLTFEQQRDKMLNTPVPKLVTRLSIPTVLSQLIIILYNTADTWFVSQIGTSASAAVGVAFSIMAVIQAIGFGLGLGAGSLVSLRLGDNKNEEAERLTISAVVAAIVAGSVLGAVGLAFLEPVMRLFGSTETILPYACDYAKYILMAAPFACTSFVLNNVLRAEGESSLAMIGICSGGVLNVILDPIFIFGLGMGTAGAAIATAISQMTSLGILFVIFLSGKSIIRLKIKMISNRFSDYKLIILTGFPTICRQGLASLASAMLNIQAAVYGDAAVAAMTIANKVYMLIRNVVLGIGQGYQPVAGYNYGAGDKKRTRQAFIFATVVGTVLCVISAVLIALFHEQIVGWFRDDSEVVRIGSGALLFLACSAPLMAYSTYVNQLYQSLGFKLPATLLASLRQGTLFLPLIIILPQVIGLVGVQFAQTGADILTFLISVPFQIVFFKKHLSDKQKM